MSEMVKMTFDIDKELKKKLMIQAINEEISIKDLLHNIIIDYLEKQ